jgi:hypothetical protein
MILVDRVVVSDLFGWLVKINITWSYDAFSASGELNYKSQVVFRSSLQ